MELDDEPGVFRFLPCETVGAEEDEGRTAAGGVVDEVFRADEECWVREESGWSSASTSVAVVVTLLSCVFLLLPPLTALSSFHSSSSASACRPSRCSPSTPFSRYLCPLLLVVLRRVLLPAAGLRLVVVEVVLGWPLPFVGLSPSADMSITSAAGDDRESGRWVMEEAEGAKSEGVAGLPLDATTRCFTAERLALSGLAGDVVGALTGEFRTFSWDRSHSASDMAATSQAHGQYTHHCKNRVW